jgi:hypothetical protein
MTKNKLQKATNEIVKWTKETDIDISVEKMKGLWTTPTEGQTAQDFRTNHRWQIQMEDVKARAGKKLEHLKTLAHKKWGEDQKTLLRIHRRIVLSTLRYGEPLQNQHWKH